MSTFSSDFEQIMTRAVSIAQLPVTQLQNEQTKILAKKQTLSNFEDAISSLQAAVERLGSLGESRALGISSSNTSLVSAQVTDAAVAAAGSYTITDIVSTAKRASEASAVGFATTDSTAVDVDDSLELVLGGQTYALDLSSHGNTLEGLRDAINASGAAVSATILHTGTGSDPYHLSISANETGATTLELRTEAGNAGTNLLTSSNQGSNAVFKLNGLDFSRAENLITDAIEGVSFTINGASQGSEAAVVSLDSNRGALSGALQDYVAAYNAVSDQVRGQIGEDAGLLTGDFIVQETQRALRALTGHFAPGTVRSLTDLGVTISRTGVMSFDAIQFNSLPSSTINASFEFLGGPTTGFGALASRLDQLANPITGAIKLQQNNYDQADTRAATRIEEINARIEGMRASLSAKLQQADVLISTLQGQQDQLTTIIESLNQASKQN
ncbi:MAG: flagellar filament capping protein FliD [Bryobacteraceae bacterium]